MEPSCQAALVKEYAATDRARGIDFKVAPLMRFALLKLSDNRYRMIWTSHHILFDGWSLPILMAEFLSNYKSLQLGEDILPREEDKFEVYIRYLDQVDKSKEGAYWSAYLAGLEQNTLLPFIAATTDRNKGVGSFKTIPLQLDIITSIKIQKFAQQNRLTVNTLVQAVWAYLLHKYTGNSNIAYGVIVSGRPEDLPGVEQRVGLYINTLILHSVLRHEQNILDWLQLLQNEQVNSRQWQHTPLQLARQWSGVQGDLFDTLLIFENYPINEAIASEQSALRVENVDHEEHTNYPLNILIQSTDTIYIRFNYNALLLDEAYVKDICGHFENVLLQLIEKADGKVGDLGLITLAEQQRLLVDFNTTGVAYPPGETVISLFEEQFLKTPEAIAVIFGEKELSYRDLHERSNKLAHYLRSFGVAKETLVPICIERGLEMIVGLLGILKAGAAYVPLDPEYPEDRIRYMLEDTMAALVISSRESKVKITGSPAITIIELDTDWQIISQQPPDNLTVAVDPKQLAYVIYTSGSTGKPKGVMIEHQSVVNMLISIAKDVHFNTGSVFLSVTTFSFDICYLEFYMPLLLGGKLIVVSREIAMDGFKLSESIRNYLPTHLQATPSTWQLLIDAEWQNKEGVKMLVGGEALKENLKSVLTQKGDIWNVYGPTETTIWSTIKKLNVNEKVLIGKPIANTNIQIINQEGKLVPVGVAGEILIGGAGLARGYYNQAALTGVKFVPNQFNNDPGPGMYCTGDLGRWLPDGNIECLGRIDEQVKIRGYRIELGEIESLLNQSGLVRQSVVLAREDYQGNNRLVGYIVPEGVFDKQVIHDYLKRKLPEYMVPALWMELETLPLTPNGKINRKALPDPDVNELFSKAYMAPRNTLEAKLANIWQQLLGVEQIGVHDNFFELGGHSLLAMRLVSYIRKELLAELSIKDLFFHSTVATLAVHLERNTAQPVLPPIAVLPRPIHIPLSFSQERLWFINKLEGSLQYHLPTVLKIQGKLDTGALSRSIQFIVNRHEVLRTVIVEEKGVGSQVIKDKDGWQLNIEDAQHYKQEPQNLKRYIQQLIKSPFDLSVDYMLRASLLMLEEEHYLLVVTMHHIASDGWSTSIIVKELVALYAAFTKGHPVQLEPLSIQYADYAIWQRKYVQGEVLNTMLDYWKQKLQNVATLDLPTDFKRPAVQSSNGATTSFLLEKELTAQLNLLSRQQGSTLFMTLLAAFKVLLYRYSGQQDICVGTPMANRTRQEVEPLIGFFINTLAIRSDLGNNPSFTGLLQQVKATTLEAYANQEAPFEKVVEAAATQRDMARNPLFQVLFTMQNTPEIPALHLDGVSISVQPTDRTTAQLDIICNIAENQDGLYGQVEYCTDLYSEQTINRMMGHYQQLLYGVVKEPGQRISDLQMLENAEQERLLNEFNNPRVDAITEETIVDLFEAQALKTPANIALVFKDEKLSYQQLNERANQLAAWLKRKGVKDGQLIPICIGRSVEMLTGIWAILKAGAVYVPIDPAYPMERIGYILQDTGASIILSSEESLVRLPDDGNLEVISIDGQWPVISKEPSQNPATSILPSQLAYIIYTSGSTGKPKGVMVTHANLATYLCNQKTNYISVDTSNTGSFVHLSYTFDASLTAMFMPLLKGKMIVLGSKGLAEIFEDDNLHRYAPYDFIKLTPSHITLLQPKMKLPGGGLLTNKLVIGGEALLAGQLSLLVVEEMDVEIINEYGPTEATVGCTVFSLNTRDQNTLPEYSIPIGKPINNVQIHILGVYNELLPQGAAGEICIAGAGIAAGYLNLDDLTAEKFVKDPYSKKEGAAMYKTGDIARWLPDGNIEYLGRKDEQVKLRGYRIELGEIENVLQQSGLVSQCVVMLVENKDDTKRLAAYIVAKENFDLASLSDFVKNLLPEYMVPSTWVEMESLPLTINGKIDKKALLNLTGNDLLIAAYEAPRNETEKAMAEIWEELLEVENPGIHDDFFNLGGHSLLAIRLVSAIRKRLEVEIAINLVFEYPTIAQLAASLEGQRQKVLLPPVEVIRLRPIHIPLSFSQERLWFINKLEGSLQYHLPTVLKIQGKLDTGALSRSIQFIVNRHEVLRTVIVEEKGVGSQVIKDKDGWQLNIEDAQHYKQEPQNLKRYIQQLIKSPFDLSVDYMLRASLLMLEEEHYLLVVTMHHIASDGWSTSIIVKELVALYAAFTKGHPVQLEPLSIQYADYAIWQRKYVQGEVLNTMLDYWKQKLQNVATLDLPTDFKRPAVQSSNGATTSFLLEKELTAQLNLLSRQQGSTLFMTLLAAFKVLLYRYSGQQDICVGTPMANRTRQEVEPLIGFFINTLAIRSDLGNNPSFTGLLQQVKATTLEAYANQEAPFEKVVEAAATQRDMARNPLFQVLFTMQNTPEIPALHLDGVSISVQPTDRTTAQLDIICNIAENQDGLYGQVEYCTDLYSEQTINRMMGHYQQLLYGVVKEPGQRISDLQMLENAEQERLLNEFNNPRVDAITEETIVDLFEAQALKTPANIALVFKDEKLSYQQLNERANQLAAWLKRKGVKDGQLIPICIGRSVEMLTGIWAILKAGAVYVPIDPAYPMERIGYILQDTGASIILSSEESLVRLPDDGNLEVISIDGQWPVISKEPSQNPATSILPSQLAYIIYTSGSTGKPKGVMVTHANLATYLCNQKTNYISVDTSNTGSFVHLSYTFDASLTAMFMPLLKGKMIVLGSKGLAEIFEDDNLHRYAPYDFIKLTPSHITLLQPKMKLPGGGLLTNKLVIGGEALLAGQLSLLVVEEMDVEIINEYGPTEATVGCTVFSLNTRDQNTLPEYSIPIGKPINNVQIHILGVYNELLPQGAAGEICIAGAGIAAGYLNLDDLTAEKFVKDPYSKKEGAAMYKTGDIARWLPDGNIEYLGRKDEQVKLRGYRIELGEIENVLQQSGLVSQCVVMLVENKDDTKRLAAYIVAKENFDLASLSDFVKNLLPEYMVPSTWVEMESLPLTINGKIDKKALLNLTGNDLLIAAYEAPRNETEKAMAEIWEELLEVENPGIHDDFFNLGGHSLLAIRLVSAIRKRLEVEIAINLVFEYPTIAQLAASLEGQRQKVLLPPVEMDRSRPTHIPLSFNQERLWFIDRLEGSVQYHVPAVIRLNGKLDIAALEYTLKSIVNRHEVLRSAIREQDGTPYQYVMDGDAWQLTITDGAGYQQDKAGLDHHIDKIKGQPFDLSKDYMLRAHLISLNPSVHILVVTLHHIASDGWSMSVIVKEVTELYNSYIQKRENHLAPLAIQYADYAIWQRRNLEGEVLNKKIGYWKNKLQDVKVLRLPTDYERPVIQSTRGAMVSVRIDKELTDRLQVFSQQQGTTLFMTLLTAFKVLLYRYSGQTDICVGTAIAGRQSQELDALIGFFVNTLALRNQLDGGGSFVALLQQVKKTTMEAYENQEVPFEKVVEATVGKRDLGTDALIQIMFALQNTPDIPELQIGEAGLTVDKYEDDTALFELWMNIAETPEGLGGYVKYCTDLYSPQTIEHLVAHYNNLLQSIIAYPLRQIATLEILSQKERRQLVVDFNNNAIPYPKNKSIVALFEEQAIKTPGKVAVAFMDEQITYCQLNERSNQLAHYLCHRGAVPGMLIPLCVDRSLNLIIAILAILKSGAAYVPLDPEYPLERINYMLSDTNASILITSSKNKSKFQHGQALELIELDNDAAATIIQPVTNLITVTKPDALAYIIYTSGSTGNPKGVMIEHGNVVSLVKGIDYVSLTENDILLSTGSPSFDATTIEYWGMLLNGGGLVLCPENTLLDNDLLKAEIIKRQVTKMWFTSSWFNQLVAYDITIFATLQTIIAGGEKLSEPTIQKIRETYPSIEIINGYGPTENTTFSLTHRIQQTLIDSPVPIGRPLNNRSAFIVDGYGQLVPVGVPGEIWLGGAGLARGYLNRPELTAEKFTDHQFKGTDALRLYKTGDQGKWQADGTILFIKRLDDQVKIRGYRVELGEIETTLNRLEEVGTSCVVVKTDAGAANRMVTYYLPALQMVKAKERQLYTSLVASWKDLYETEYAKTELAADIDPEFNIIGWNDSFTGQPIPSEQMREWLSDIMNVIMLGNPEQVLEIGTGTGLIYYQLAGKIKKYTGMDFSASSVKQVSDRISKGLKDYGATELRVCAAHEIAVKQDEQIDTVILNSIVQYFPGEDYMTEVIGKAIAALKNGGRVIVGDVRDNRLLELFKGLLQLKKMQDSAGIKEFKWAVAQDVIKEEELCFSPAYFYRLQSLFPRVTHVEINWKQGTFINELTRYRFTVILHVGTIAEIIKPLWQDWENPAVEAIVYSGLERNSPVALKNVPNPRLWQERLMDNALQDKSLRTVRELLNRINGEDEETTRIKDLLAGVSAKGFSYRLMPDEDPLKVNVFFEQKRSHLFIEQPGHQKAIETITGTLTNIPLLGDITALLQKDIRLLLQQSLPDYMIPAELIAVAQLPLTNNGKVDRVFLSQLEDKGKGSKFNYVAPRNETEKALAGIWQQLLGLDTVSIHDNFFEIGGHSLLATRVKSAIRKEFEKDVAIKDIFMYPTIALLCEQLLLATASVVPAIEILPRPAHIPLSYSQERLWFIDQLEGSIAYNSPAVLRLKGKLSQEALIYTLQNIINRHEVLRTVFGEADGKPFQNIMDVGGWKLSYVDDKMYQDNNSVLQNLIETLVSAPFDLSADYMLRADLVKMEEDDHILVVTIHHIAYDGWSLPVIVKEVVELYSAYISGRAAMLPPLPLQFADFAIWQRSRLQGQLLDEKIGYWKNKLEGVPPLQLPTDYSRPAIRTLRGASFNFLIDKELAKRLNQLSLQQGTTLYMTLLATFNVLLNRYTGQQDICVGASIANRPQPELEALIGFFVNTLALRTPVHETQKFIDLLQQVKTTTLEAYDHQDVPFEKVVEAVVKDRDPGRSPLFQVMLVLLNTPEPARLGLGEIILSHQTFENKISKFDITFHVSRFADSLPVSIEYNTDLFRQDTITRMAGHFVQLLKSVVNDPGQVIDSLQMLTEAEEQQLLVEFD